MVNSKKKNIEKQLMEGLYVGNLANDTIEGDILALLGLDGTIYLRQNSFEREQYTDNGRFAGCIHVQMSQQFLERPLWLNGLKFKSRNIVTQSLKEMMKLQRGGKRNNYTLYEVSLFGPSTVGRGERMDTPGEGIRLPHVKIIGSRNEYRIH